MGRLKKVKKTIAALILAAFVPSQAWAQGVTIPAGSTLGLNTGTLTVGGAITNAGTLSVTTGNINLSGNWANSGTFNAGSSTVTLTGSSGTQTLNSGGTAAADTFNNLAHNGAGTAQLSANALKISGSLANSAGTFDANNLNITLNGNWDNTAAFTPGTGTVTLGGTGQSVLGSTTFYNFSKAVTSADTLTFDSGGTQNFTNSLTMTGASGQLLSIRSNNNGTAANIRLSNSGSQSIDFVNVKDSNAGTAGTNQTLVGRNGTDSGNNTNWSFNNATITWAGGASGDTTDWNNPANWNPMVVPASGDTVVIPGGTTYEPSLCPSGHAFACSATVTIGNLTVGSGGSASSASLTLNGTNLTVSSSFSNNGTVDLQGTETLTLTMDSTHGTFAYVGAGGGSSASHTLTVNGSSAVSFNNLAINDTNAHPDVFQSNGNLTINGALTVTSGTLDISTNSNTATVTGAISVNGANGALTATNGNITANGGVSLSAGAFTAPGSGKTFTVSGSWTNSGATFTPSGGTVALNGTGQSISGTTTFYNLSKTVASADTLTFDSAGTQTVNNSLTLQGASGNLLKIRSSTSGIQAKLYLAVGGSQSISYVDVKDSNAGTAGTQQTLVARNGTDSTNNTNWDFNSATITWTGNTSTDWSTAGNWNPMVVPQAGDSVTIPNAAHQPILSSNVTVGALTINSGSTATLSGHNLTVDTSSSGTGDFTNNGTLILNGSETVTLVTVNVNAGTFEYDGDNTGSTYNIANLLTTTNPSNHVYYNLTINDTHATADIFTIGNNPLTVDGSVAVQGGTLDLSGSSAVSATGSVSISAGATLKAPASATTTAFTVGGNWTNNGTFNNGNGEVNFNTSTTATIAGTTTFYNFYSHTAGKTFDFTAGTTQTVSNTLSLQGTISSPIALNSTASGSAWNISISSAQTATGLNVFDSNALNNTITCLACDQSVAAPINTNARDNSNWIFESLEIVAPANATTVGQNPTLVGTALAGDTVYIRDISNNLVATTKADANGKFRVVVGKDDASTGQTITTSLATGANSLTPYLSVALTNPGSTNAVTVVASPTTSQIPAVTSLNGNTIGNPGAVQFISGSTPAIAGKGLAGQPVTGQALDAGGNLIETATLGTVDSNGNYSVTWPSSTPLPSQTNALSIIVGSSGNETASPLIQLSLTDPFGVVYNSTTNQPVQGASVGLYNAATKQLATAGIKSCNSQGTCCDTSGTCTDLSGNTTSGNPSGNPFTTGSDGFYSFLAPAGQYYINVSAAGFKYPSTVTTVPSGRTDGTGSKGETFTVGSAVFELDQPMDGTNSLLRIVKTANKSEASVGDIVTYTVTIQNLSSTNAVTGVYLNDLIPPGFKYIQDRVLLDGTPISNPAGQRPVSFNVGTVAAAQTRTLEYQLVIGSGVTMGNYMNTATAQYANGLVISNPTVASVKLIPDPVFDLGTVIGKVFFDWNENGIQDAPFYDDISHETIVEKPVPNVQIVMEDGTVITTDRDGKFSIPGLLPGRHLFRLDERTLPPGAYLTTDKAVIVDVTAGSISKVNFGVNIDQSQAASKDAVFFNEKLRLTEDRNRPVPRLNAALFDSSANAKAGTEEVMLHEGALVRKGEFRIFTNYSPFISRWDLDILDADTKKLLRRFSGTSLNINDPIYWDGHDDHDVIIDSLHKYSYVLTVYDSKDNRDTTKENPITIRDIKDPVDLKKELDDSKDVLKDRADRYRKWLQAGAAANNLDHQLIPIVGETIHLDRQGTDVRSLRVMKGNELFTDIPLSQQYGLTPAELAAGGFSTDEKDNIEIILPNGDYTLDVVSAKTATLPGRVTVPLPFPEGSRSGSVPSPSADSSSTLLEHYSRPLKVGDDYMLFVALGDAQAGYNIDTGHIEPIQDKTQEPGFYKEGKAAYYLKGQILGKYLITSSYDSDRAQKALFRQLDPNVYYPVYGDQSTINYDAADTQGALYLKIEWDKSSAVLGNYAVDFNDTEFASFSRAYYGGKLDYQSVATNPYGDARTKLVVYHAQVQQLPDHDEFLATGGSLYFLKYKNVIQGSDKVTIQVRDATTGLVLNSQTMTNGADYEIDLSQGRILFWQPVSMIAQSESIISNNLVNGNPIYVVVDYQYAVSGLQTTGSQGVRMAQAVGDNLVLGGTYVHDDSGTQAYNLEGTDATLHLNQNATIKAEYAQTQAAEEGSYVSTDGGITFTSLSVGGSASGKAYGMTGDARLFDNVGLKTYYKWIDAGFGAAAQTSQQGKEMTGLCVTWDMSPVTRITASEDIQKLMAGANLQASVQVGASETDTTMVQIVHQAEKLKLTGQFQLTQVKNVINGIESTTNTQASTIGGQAQYDLTSRIKLTLGQQVDVQNSGNTATTLGVAARLTDTTTAAVQDVIGQQGTAVTGSITNQIGKRIDVTTGYTLTNLKTGEVDKTVTVQAEDKLNKNIALTGTAALTGSSTGTTTTTAAVGAKTKINGMDMDLSVGKSQSSTGAQGSTSLNASGTTQIGNTTLTATAMGTGGLGIGSPALGVGTTNIASNVGIQATTKVNENTETNANINMATDTTGAKTTTFGFGQTSKLDQELQAVTANSFSLTPGNVEDSSKYGLVRTTAAGQKAEADFTKATTQDAGSGSITQSNIFGLTGDVNDKVALNGSIDRGRVQNLDGSRTIRTDFSVGAGYVLKDTETATERLKNSLKLEYRVDKGEGTDSLHQYVVYDAIDGKITDNWSVNAKLDYSKTMDETTGAKAESHKEIILGMAYRPVNFDNLNFIGEYSYQEGYGGGTQQADALNTNVNQTITQVLSAEGVYDINDQWQAAEKIAYRIMSEQDTGFQFTQTHTWLMVHRLNYKIDKDWTLSGELRDLAQVEAKDNKLGFLFEAVRNINDNTQMAIGWNFTHYSDDLSDLSYTATGPYVRMTGKFYDETPEEKARARAKWLDAKVNQWAWMLIRKELSRKDSTIVRDLNHMFGLAKAEQKAGHFEESRQIYKDIISAGQIMYDEAAQYIRGRIDFEEQMQKLDKTAREYFKGGEYVKARKIWEKVVEDASMDGKMIKNGSLASHGVDVAVPKPGSISE